MLPVCHLIAGSLADKLQFGVQADIPSSAEAHAQVPGQARTQAAVLCQDDTDTQTHSAARPQSSANTAEHDSHDEAGFREAAAEHAEPVPDQAPVAHMAEQTAGLQKPRAQQDLRRVEEERQGWEEEQQGWSSVMEEVHKASQAPPGNAVCVFQHVTCGWCPHSNIGHVMQACQKLVCMCNCCKSVP